MFWSFLLFLFGSRVVGRIVLIWFKVFGWCWGLCNSISSFVFIGWLIIVLRI